ncbi:hypothetical protein [Paenibacillus beijingensis]|uniref:Phospholipase C/D domain-containing protein n=1 Tax=Paenibacillus beijingensis TaxID=1126833 RepID=A0A0D5NE36_9BACL|nr:hypothetical protein [Paenibacillus beijingensis]AJY73629.1 hypothetical protein VN24_02035 [Paenibacillus beijingensis]
MPTIWSHILFGQKVLETVGVQQLIALPERERLFNLGCQGPDFLFYHRYLPWQKSETARLLGKLMHTRSCGPAMMEMLDAVCGLPVDGTDSDPGAVYVLGFMLHHIFDRNLNPYVIGSAGFQARDRCRFEATMDTLFLRKLKGMDAWNTPVWKEIDPPGTLPRNVLDGFEQITAVYYEPYASFMTRDVWDEAVRDMISAQRLFHDPYGGKRVLTLGRIEPYVYKREPNPPDILNESGRLWRDPFLSGKTSSESAIDLWQRAMDEAVPLVKAVLRWFKAAAVAAAVSHSMPDSAKEAAAAAEDAQWHAADLRQTVRILIGNRSYDTGLPLAGAAELNGVRYAEPI